MFVSSGQLLMSTTRPTEWTGVCSSHFKSDCVEVQPGLFKNLVCVVEEQKN